MGASSSNLTCMLTWVIISVQVRTRITEVVSQFQGGSRLKSGVVIGSLIRCGGEGVG